MNVTGKTMIFRKVFDGRISYSRSISWHPFKEGKVDNNTWERTYETVKFPKDVDIPDKTMIEVTKGFESGFTKDDGEIRRMLIVQEYKLCNPDPADSFFAIDEASPF